MSSAMTCIDKPVSWLALEQYHLGELPESEGARVQSHLDTCEGCRSSLDFIENDPYVLKPLPSLDDLAVKDSNVEDHAIAPLGRRRINWLFAGGAFAAAAAAAVLAMIMVWPGSPSPGQFPGREISFKGGDLAMTLVRDRDGQVMENPTGYVDADRFRLHLTCPLDGQVKWDVVVFQGAEVFFPYENRPGVSCGNNVPLPGAFRMTGTEEATICVMVDEIPRRSLLRSKGKRALPKGTVCAPIQSLNR